jgi:hypothetical protein
MMTFSLIMYVTYTPTVLYQTSAGNEQVGGDVDVSI